MCRAPLQSAVVLRSQTGLTANLQGFRIGAPEGWPSCDAVASAGPIVPSWCGPVTGSYASPTVRGQGAAVTVPSRMEVAGDKPRKRMGSARVKRRSAWLLHFDAEPPRVGLASLTTQQGDLVGLPTCCIANLAAVSQWRWA